MPRLLVVHHTPSPALHTMLTAILEGAGADGLEAVDVVSRPALAATTLDVLEADAVIVGTPANLGYMSGALKHFFDQIYYPCLDATAQRPYGVFVHGNNDVDGAVSSIERIVTGLDWRQVTDHVRVIGDPTSSAHEACWNLGATVGASLLP